MSPSAPLLEVSQLRKHFVVRQGLWGRARGAVRAVDGVDLHIRAGETLGVQELQRFRQLAGGDVQAMVTHAREARVRGGELRQRGVMHHRAERMRDRIAEHAELAGREGGRPEGRQREGFRRAHRSVPRRGRK